MKIDKLNPTSWIIHGLTLLVPLLVLPGVVDNAFEAPKGALILSGVLLLVAIHGFNYFRGKGVLCSRAATSQVVLLLLLLNALNLLYTENLYYSRVAVVMNVGSLCFFYFVSLSIASRGAQRVFAVIACSGLVVAILALLQSAGHFVFFKPIDPAGQVAGTIGNANSLGAYLIFPVTVLTGAAFLWPPKWRGVASIFLVVSVAGLIVSRARASWIGCGVAGAVLTLLLVKINRFSFRRFFLQSPRRALFYGIALIVLCGSAWSLVPERWQSNLSVASLTDQTGCNPI